MTTAAVFGPTGAVGSKILDALLASNTFSVVKTISRRAPQPQSPKLEALVEPDSTKWGPMIASLQPLPGVVFNAIGTTRAQAGGIQNQWKIDHDLCIDNAKASKEAGVKTYVFISSAGTRGMVARMAPYCKMKNGVEDAIKDIGFEQAIILKPGAILGEREVPKNAFVESFFGNLNKISQGLQDAFGKPTSKYSAVDGVLLIKSASCRSRSTLHRQSCGCCCTHGTGGQSAVQVLGGRSCRHSQVWQGRMEGVRSLVIGRR